MFEIKLELSTNKTSIINNYLLFGQGGKFLERMERINLKLESSSGWIK